MTNEPAVIIPLKEYNRLLKIEENSKSKKELLNLLIRPDGKLEVHTRNGTTELGIIHSIHLPAFIDGTFAINLYQVTKPNETSKLHKKG